MKDRLQRILQEKQLTSARLADRIEVQRSSISHILSGRNKPSMDFMEKILSTFPEISGDWLITGRGAMYKDGRGSAPSEEAKWVTPSNNRQGLFDTDETMEAPVNKSVENRSAVNQEREYAPVPPPKPAKVVKRVVIYYDDNSYDELFLNK